MCDDAAVPTNLAVTLFDESLVNRNAEARSHRRRASESESQRFERPEQRIASDEQWTAADAWLRRTLTPLSTILLKVC